MRRILAYIMLMMMLLVPTASRANWYYGVYYDYKTSALLLGTMTTQLLQEQKAGEYLEDILKSYGKVNVAVSGMYLTKNLERKALHDAGILGVPGQENYYYQHIYRLVYERIIPEILRCGILLIDHVDQVYVWGPQLNEICNDVHSLCQQFSAVVSNGTLTFNFDFPKVSERVMEIVGISDLARVDWEDFFDSLASIDVAASADSIKNDLRMDFDDLYAAGKQLISTGGGALDTLWANRSKVGQILKGKPQEIKAKVDSLKEFFDGVTNTYDVKSQFEEFMGTVDSLTILTKFFEYRDCDPSQLIYDFSQDGKRNTYYKERWYIERRGTVLYEEWFDSYTMDEESFEERMNGKLKEYQADDVPPLFLAELKKDQHSEYQQTEELHTEGATQAVYTVTCDDGGVMVEGSYSFKVNPRHDPLNEDSKKYAMETRLDPNEYAESDLNTVSGKVDYWSEEYDKFNQEYDDLDAKIGELYDLFGQGQMTYDGQDISTVINNLANDRQKASNNRQAAKDSLNVWSTAYSELMEDLVDDGDIQRIPHIMNEVQGIFSLRWLDEGHWEGYTWIRKAYLPSAKQTVTLRVQLVRQRGESYLLGFITFIRIHRSIIRMDFKLTYEGSSENVVEYLDLDPNASETDTRRVIQEHLLQWQNEYPECMVSVETRVTPGVKDSISDHKVHLLWASDRVRIARDINSRLELIYARLQVMERTLLYTKSLWTRVSDEIHNIVTDPVDKSWCYGLITDRNNRMRQNMNAAPLRRRQGGYDITP